ncbi:MAG: Hsp33 family molecular chaperone HslO [Hylemonella sp.]|uniref:Hsp33 family molecular chaperone HslO n=1 Tax=Hylemonella sp. TaxID=2066020 RepID=UPI0022BE80FF|nr:Hsp33 family molecular chaperone HslO [Hylemonella sp.]MCZ8252019.1 Hsp33 family molecular chaperone HslO [Hylemonella sp.]
MSELHKFLFEGLPVRGMVVRLTDAWTEILKRRAQSSSGPYPASVQALLGEMAAAGALMQSNIKFDGALILQVFGDGPVKLAVAEVQSDLSLRATATVQGEVPAGAGLAAMLNVHGQGRCAVTLDPQGRQPGQQPYQGVVPLTDPDGHALQSLSQALQLYMRQSEQLETTLVLAAGDHVAAGLLIQRLPVQGMANLAGQNPGEAELYEAEQYEHYNRIATLAASLKREELLTLDVETILRRLFWEEKLQRFEPQMGEHGPRFACTCSRERVSGMIRGLGEVEAREILAERGVIQVDCEFCGAGYRYDDIDVTQLFTQAGDRPPSSSSVQ